jgi:o-succinylbenzoate synthase
MKLAELTWTIYRIPFRGAFRTAHGPLNYRSGALVTAHTDEGYTGIGEIAPLPEQSGASLYVVLRTLALLRRTLRGRELTEILRFLAHQSEEGQLPSSLIFGLETALFDVLGKARGQSLASLLASGYPCEERHASVSPRARVPVNAVIGGASIERAVELALAAVKAGFTCLKLKLTDASRSTLDRVAALRAAIGPEISLRLDANASWSFEQALFLLTRCAPFDIQYIEQPISTLDLAGMARLRLASPIPIAADEAVSDLSSARRILEAGAADVLILKPQMAGGLQSCRRIIQEASSRHVSCVLTSALEAGIGVAATLHLAAASPEVILPCGLATLALLEDDLLQKDLAIEQGNMLVPPGSGLGVALDTSNLHG